MPPDVALAATLVLHDNTTSSKRASCGLVKFCFSAARLAQQAYLAGRLEPVVLTNAPSYAQALCQTEPRPRMLLHDSRLESAVAVYNAARTRASARTGYSATIRLNAMAGLSKLQVLALTEYSAVLVIDLDLDLFFPSRGAPPKDDSTKSRARHAWTTMLSAFLASPMMLVGRADRHSPINSAALLFKPSKAIYEMALETLERGRFDRRTGWDHAGRPSDVVALGGLPKKLARNMNSSAMLRVNDWSFVGAEGEQGLLVYLYLVRLKAQTYAHSGLLAPWADQWQTGQNGQRKVWRPNHFFYHFKPWHPYARCATYFEFLDHRALRLDGSTYCARFFREKQRCLPRNGGGRLRPKACAACSASSTTMIDAESKAQLEWACGQRLLCPSRNYTKWSVF